MENIMKALNAAYKYQVHTISPRDLSPSEFKAFMKWLYLFNLKTILKEKTK